ncbi:MAG: aspartate--tRNA ligase [Candidatus Eremiobacteraeota bacterium]|nr:aspartate--tRNA ligase [Candidatus Eremiobacteraeota bacterium]MBV9698909.1 aspartate--tRNA ligase [Candidatus Eremiobacteraeota bacterium]
MPARVSCGALRATDEGTAAQLCGWVNRRRDHGGLIFVDVRDRDGITQIVFDPSAACFAAAEHLRNEDVLRVAGAVRRRPAGTENERLPTGEIEVAVDELEILNRSQVPPFAVNSDDPVDENLRLEYRYLDLRRARMQENLRVRHRIIKALRDFFDERGFLEIETPMLMKSTPEGARDYLVPSRIYPGAFYALPQSPQLLKQILMIAGFGRYMQIARCMRDEDQRADRQPEFTQLDVELSFCTQEEVLETMESAMRYVWRRALGIEVGDFPRLTHRESLARYGLDKPDLRFGLELAEVGSIFAETDFGVFRAVAQGGGAIVALRYPGGAALSRRDFDALTETAKQYGGKGMVWIALSGGAPKSPAAKFLTESNVEALRTAVAAEIGDAILLFADERAIAYAVAGKMRNEVGERCKLRATDVFAFAWVTDFPYLEIDETTGVPAPAHHPFTSPAPGDWELIDRAPMEMRAQHYDLVLNGYELGSGSIRIHKPDQQRRIFEMLGMSPAEVEERFGFFMRALDYGAPPHGGMALGIDRIAMLACGEETIREVIAFPKNQVARDVMMNAPSRIPDQLVHEVHLGLLPSARAHDS